MRDSKTFVTGPGISIDTMRRIDRWVGIPLCAVATIFAKAWWRLRPRPAPAIRRVLFIELSEMGSCILANPAMRKLHDRVGAELFFVIFAANAGSLVFTPVISPERI